MQYKNKNQTIKKSADKTQHQQDQILKSIARTYSTRKQIHVLSKDWHWHGKRAATLESNPLSDHSSSLSLDPFNVLFFEKTFFNFPHGWIKQFQISQQNTHTINTQISPNASIKQDQQTITTKSLYNTENRPQKVSKKRNERISTKWTPEKLHNFCFVDFYWFCLMFLVWILVVGGWFYEFFIDCGFDFSLIAYHFLKKKKNS